MPLHVQEHLLFLSTCCDQCSTYFAAAPSINSSLSSFVKGGSETDGIIANMIGLAAKTYAVQATGCTLVSSVLPTPVGPQNMRAAIGRLGSFSPTRARFKAEETADTASSCPITRACTPAFLYHI